MKAKSAYQTRDMTEHSAIQYSGRARGEKKEGGLTTGAMQVILFLDTYADDA